jgi:hypothetical protein
MISNEVMAKLIAERNTSTNFRKGVHRYKHVNGTYIDLTYLFAMFRDDAHDPIFPGDSRFRPSEESINRIEEFVLDELEKESDKLLAIAEENFRKEIGENIEL